MKINRAQVVMATVLIAGTAVLAELLTPRTLMAESTASFDLETAIPKQFGNWKLVPSIAPVKPGDSEGYAQLESVSKRIYAQELARGYTDGKGNVVMFLVAYGPVQNFRLKAHRPEICYQAAGFTVSKSTTSELSVKDRAGPIEMTRLLAERGPRLEPISYWMRVGNDVATGIFSQQYSRFKYGLQGLVPDGALVRISTIGLQADASYKLQEEFIKDLFAALPKESRKFLAGTS